MPGTAHRRGAERDPARALGAFRPRPGVLATVPGSTVFSLRGGVVVVPRGVPAPPRPARANRLSGPAPEPLRRSPRSSQAGDATRAPARMPPRGAASVRAQQAPGDEPPWGQDARL